MKLPMTKRLLLCAELVPPCETVADVGTDHGYLGIHLLREGKCSRVLAADLREKPLASAQANAERYGIPIVVAAAQEIYAPRKAFPLGGRCPSAHTGADEGRIEDRAALFGMTFIQSDGLHNIEPGSFDALVLAGMGGDLISRILAEAPWLDGGDYTLVLQPQSAANDLRRWLGERSWSIARERLVRDGRFLYAVMVVRPEQGRALTPGEQYVSPALRREGDPLYAAYLARMRRALELTVQGITQSADPADQARAAYYRAALDEITALGPAPEPSPSGEGVTSAHTGDG